MERHDLRSQASFHHSAIRLALVFLRAPVSSNFGTSNSLNRQFSLFKDVKMTIFLGMDGYGLGLGLGMIGFGCALSDV